MKRFALFFIAIAAAAQTAHMKQVIAVTPPGYLTITGGLHINSDIWPATDAAGVLTNDGIGNLTWAPSGALSVCGANTQVIYNNTGACGADADLTRDYTNNILAIHQTTADSAGRLFSVMNHAGSEVFGLNGSAASPFPNYLFITGAVPYTDNTGALGASNSAWATVNSHIDSTEQQYVCLTGVTFLQADCALFKVPSAGALDMWLPWPSFRAIEYLSNTFTGQHFAQFSLDLIPNTDLGFDLGTNTKRWQNGYINHPFLGASATINTLNYNWPGSHAVGFLKDDGAGNLTWSAASGGLTSLNGLTGPALTIAGTTNEITVAPSGTTITLSTPQAIATNSNVQFANLTLTAGINAFSAVFTSSLDMGGGSFHVDSSGNLTAHATSVTTFTAVGNATIGGNLIPTINNLSSLGDSAHYWANFYATTALFSGGTIGIGSTGIAIGAGKTYFANGLAGQNVTTTVRNSANTGSCTLVFTGGIKTGGTC